jgi:hypothetical protein
MGMGRTRKDARPHAGKAALKNDTQGQGAPADPTGGVRVPVGLWMLLGLALLGAGVAGGLWYWVDPPRRLSDLCYSLDQAVDICPTSSG